MVLKSECKNIAPVCVLLNLTSSSSKIDFLCEKNKTISPWLMLNAGQQALGCEPFPIIYTVSNSDSWPELASI